jgi:hypothetical protein
METAMESGGMASRPVRIKDETYTEVSGVARVMGATPGDLLGRAWAVYRETEEFRSRFEFAKKAISAGDFEALADAMDRDAEEWAAQAADEVRALRRR